MARLGTPLVSFDQEIGGGQHAPCYSAAHGHAPGYGNWMWTDFRDLCRAILKEGKGVAPELGLLMENTSELAIPYMATYWSRQFGEFDLGGVGWAGRGPVLVSLSRACTGHRRCLLSRAKERRARNPRPNCGRSCWPIIWSAA